MTRKTTKEAINFIKKNNNLVTIKEKLSTFHPADLSLIFTKLNKYLRYKIYNSLDDQQLAELFSYLDFPQNYLDDLDAEKATNILDKMEIDDVSNLLFEITDLEKRQIYIDYLSPNKKQDITYILEMKEDRVGRIISTNYISVEANMDVKDAMKKLIRDSSETELIDPIFVLDNGNFVGILSLNDLIIARSPKLISEIMDDNPVSTNINDPIINATSIIRNYSLTALPVLDNKKLVGIITSDDAFEIYSDHAETKYVNLAGVSSDNLDDKRFFKRLLERLPWLVGLLLLSLITTNLMGVYEDVIQQITILMFFQILILDMAGNVGTQSLAVTLQTLIHNTKMEKSEVRKHILKEIFINTLNALFLMIISFVVSYIFITIYGSEYSTATLAFTISLSMGLTLIISSFFGAMLPIFFNKIRINPAVASGPLITTINDIVSILIYFNLAALLFRLTI